MTPWVIRLLIANVVVFLLTKDSGPLLQLLAFRADTVLLRPWTPLTYMFLHAGTGHIFFNMLSLYFFGPAVEARLGGRRFITLWLVSGLAGAALSVFTPSATIVGASGALFGVMFVFASLFPHERIYVWGVLPIPARIFVLLMTGISLLGVRGYIESGVAHYAHLGGFVGGWLYLKWLEWRSPRAVFKRRVETLVPARAGSETERWSAISREGLHPLNLEELDRLQGKISTHGISSLTGEERAFLERLSLRSTPPAGGGPGPGPTLA